MDMAVLQFLAAPFVASLILTGIHAYLGVHVVERGVIFVDLSLAQIAALGATVAILLPGHPAAIRTRRSSTGSASPSRSSARSCSRCFASAMRRIPQEAIIGICYAVASGGGDSGDEQGDVRERASQGHARRQHPRRVLAGSREDGAAVRGGRRCSTTSVRRQFLAISLDPEAAEAQGLSIRLWDFLFYASFGFVVTSSVAIAGVLLVFCYLIVPSVGRDAVR